MNINEYESNKDNLENVEKVELAIKEYLETKNVSKLIEVKDISINTEPFGDKDLGYLISTGDINKIVGYFNKTTNFSMLDETLAKFEEDLVDLIKNYKDAIPIKEMIPILSTYIENPKWIEELTDSPSNFSHNDDMLIKYIKQYGANLIVNLLKKIGASSDASTISELRSKVKGKLPVDVFDSLTYGFKAFSAEEDLKELKKEQEVGDELREKHLQEKIDLAEKQAEEEKKELNDDTEKKFSIINNKLNTIVKLITPSSKDSEL